MLANFGRFVPIGQFVDVFGQFRAMSAESGSFSVNCRAVSAKFERFRPTLTDLG